jgi:hypothetical protein
MLSRVKTKFQFFCFLKGQNKNFVELVVFDCLGPVHTNCVVVSDHFGVIEYKEVTKSGRFQPLGSVR